MMRMHISTMFNIDKIPDSDESIMRLMLDRNNIIFPLCVDFIETMHDYKPSTLVIFIGAWTFEKF